jgi:hypothetical protein
MISQKHEITSALKHLVNISMKSGEQSVIDWDEDKCEVNLSDPYLSFSIWQIRGRTWFLPKPDTAYPNVVLDGQMVSPASASGAIMRRVPSHHPDPALRRRPKGPGQRHPNALKSCKPKQNDRLQGIAPDGARRRHDQHPQREQQALNALAGFGAPLRGAVQQLARIQHGRGRGRLVRDARAIRRATCKPGRRKSAF